MLVTNDNVRTVGSCVTILVAIVGGVWYFATLDGRVRDLTLRVQALEGPNAQLGKACAKLMEQMAEEQRAGESHKFQAGSLENTAREYGCIK
jgi:hypothetical protein